jgi:phosphoglycerate dehydrogenase-like enzyme
VSKPLVLIYEDLTRVHYGRSGVERLRERFPSLEFEYADGESANVSARCIADAEVIGTVNIAPEELAIANKLRWIHTWANGADPMLYPEMMASDVTLTCSRGNGAIPLAEHAMMLMLILNRNAMRWIRAQDEHRWDRFTHEELNGLTVGIIGLGNSGVDLAEKAKAFHMQVLGIRKRDIPVPFVDEMFTRDRLDELVARSDFLVVTAALTPETKGMIGEAQLRLMKPSSCVVVFSRGGIIEDNALIRALSEGWIAGAGLDAHAVEPLPTDSPYWHLKNTIITPHDGAVTPKTWARGAATFERNLGRYLAGEPFEEAILVDKTVGY